MTTIPMSVPIDTVIKNLRRKMRMKQNASTRYNMTLASRAQKEWGDFVIYHEKELRDLVADSIAHRLALNPQFVRERLSKLSQICLDLSKNEERYLKVEMSDEDRFC